MTQIDDDAEKDKPGFLMGLKESDEVSGPTEKFIHNYGKRVHHTSLPD